MDRKRTREQEQRPNRPLARTWVGGDLQHFISVLGEPNTPNICPGCGHYSMLIPNAAATLSKGNETIPCFQQVSVQSNTLCILCTIEHDRPTRRKATFAGILWYLIGDGTVPQAAITQRLWAAVNDPGERGRRLSRKRLLDDLVTGESDMILELPHQALNPSDVSVFERDLSGQIGDDGFRALSQETKNALLAQFGVQILLDRDPRPTWAGKERFILTDKGVDFCRAYRVEPKVIVDRSKLTSSPP